MVLEPIRLFFSRIPADPLGGLKAGDNCRASQQHCGIVLGALDLLRHVDQAAIGVTESAKRGQVRGTEAPTAVTGVEEPFGASGELHAATPWRPHAQRGEG